MIVEMSKITLLMLKDGVEQGLGELRQLGLVHVEHIKPPVSEDISFIEEQISGVDKAIGLLSVESCQHSEPHGDKATLLIQEILNLNEEQIELERRKEDVLNQLAWYEQWGVVSLASAKSLNQEGFNLRLYRAPKSFAHEQETSDNVFIVGEDKNELRVVLVSKDKEARLDFKEESLPEIEHKELKESLRKIEKSLETIDENVCKLSKHKERLQEYKEELIKQRIFADVRYGMGEDQSIVYVQGYAPAEKAGDIKKISDKNGWGYVISVPEELDEPPTLIKSKKWIGIIAPLFKFMGTTPGYREYDISMWFLLFLSLFFAMLIGDAGYGIIFLLLTMFARKKAPQAPIQPFCLIYVLATATIIWGVITGTWFGAEIFVRSGPLKTLAVFKEKASDQTFMMHFCFVLGAIHLTIAHLLVAWKNKKNKRKAITQVGWASIVWGLFFVAGMLVLGREFPLIGKIFMGVGLSLVIVGSTGAEIGNLPLDIISAFSDVVSYLRLFAVGYASVIVAQSFNTMAIGDGVTSILGGFMAAFILFAGHTLNIVLGLMAIIVHGVRLNMLEFSGHLGMEWSGKEYAPFKE